MGTEIKPPIHQGPIVRPDQTDIDTVADSNSLDHAENSTAENVQTSAPSAQGMKQAATEMKGSMKTTGYLLQQALADMSVEFDSSGVEPSFGKPEPLLRTNSISGRVSPFRTTM